MQHLGRIFALFACLALIFGGAPAVAAGASCDPCPPDCPMMKQMAAATDHAAKAPAKDRKAGDSCKGLVCQPLAAATPAVARTEQPLRLARLSDVLRPSHDLPAESRPPDRSLRPPIQL